MVAPPATFPPTFSVNVRPVININYQVAITITITKKRKIKSKAKKTDTYHCWKCWTQ